MSAWSGLLKKEFRLGLIGVYMAFFLLVACIGFGIFLTWRIDAPEILFTISLAVIIGHLFYLPGYLVVSLSGEKGKMHLWLHSPHNGTVLLLAKFLNGLLAMGVSLLLTSVVALYTGGIVFDISQLNLSWGDAFVIGISVIAHVIGTSIYFTIWGVFLWVISQLLAQYVGKLRWPVMIAIVIGGLSLITKWETSTLYMLLTEWGAISVDFSGIMLNFEASGMSVEAGNASVFYIGTYVYYAVVAILVFLITGWLLDRKVEV